MKTTNNPSFRPEGKIVYYSQGRRNTPCYEIAVVVIDGNDVQFFTGQEWDNESRVEAMLKAIASGQKSVAEMLAAGWKVPQLVLWAVKEGNKSEFVSQLTYQELTAALQGRVELGTSRKATVVEEVPA